MRPALLPGRSGDRPASVAATPRVCPFARDARGGSAAYNSAMALPPALAPVCRSTELRAIEAAARDLPLMERAGLAAAEVARTMAGERGGGDPRARGTRATTAATRSSSRAGCGNGSSSPIVVFRGDPSQAAAGCGGRAPRVPRRRRHDGSRRSRGLARRADRRRALRHRPHAPAGGRLRGDRRTCERVRRSDSRARRAERASTRTPASRTAPRSARAQPRRSSRSSPAFSPAPMAIVAAGRVGARTRRRRQRGDERGRRLDWPVLAAALPEVLRRRARNVHKGTFGTLGIVGGAAGMVGAPLLAGRAALHAGAGKVWIGFVAGDPPPSTGTQPELMLRTADRVVGAGAERAGLRPGSWHRQPPPTRYCCARDSRGRAARARRRRAEPDCRAARPRSGGRRPHGAYARHAASGRGGAPACARSVPRSRRDRIAAAQAIAALLGASVVLKGAGSVLAHPDGTWDINASGNPGARFRRHRRRAGRIRRRVPRAGHRREDGVAPRRVPARRRGGRVRRDAARPRRAHRRRSSRPSRANLLNAAR